MSKLLRKTQEWRVEGPRIADWKTCEHLTWQLNSRRRRCSLRQTNVYLKKQTNKKTCDANVSWPYIILYFATVG